MFKRLSTAVLLLICICACDLIKPGGGKEPPFSDDDFWGGSRVILGETLEICSGSIRPTDPVISVGELELETEVVTEGEITRLRIKFPLQPELNKIYPGLNQEDGTFNIVMKAVIEGEEGVQENTIARVRIYEKSGPFFSVVAGTPAKTDLSGAYAVYAYEYYLSGNTTEPNWNSYVNPAFKITADGAEQLVFEDSEGVVLRDVRMQAVKAISKDYVYARLVYPSIIDTVYNEYTPGDAIGDIWQNISSEEMNVLIDTRDGRLIEMPDFHDENGMFSARIHSWVHGNRFAMTESSKMGIFMYGFDGNYVHQEEQIGTDGNAYPNFVLFNDSEMMYDAKRVYRLDGTGYEELHAELDEGVVKDMDAFNIVCVPSVFLGGDGKFYSILEGYGGRGCRLYCLEDGLWTIAGNVGYKAQGYETVSLEAFSSKGNIYITGDKKRDGSGAYYVLDASGNLSETGYVHDSSDGMYLIPVEGCVEPEYLYYLNSGNNWMYRKSISDASAPEKWLERGDTYPFRTDVSGRTCIMCFPGTERCLIVDGDQKYDLQGIKGLPHNDMHTYTAIPRY